MSATVEVPASVVERVRQHLAKTGRPLLPPGLRRDWPLVALPSDLGYLLLLHPETPAAQLYFEMAEESPRDVVDDLAKCAVEVLADVPRRFTLAGGVVGAWQVIGDSVCVRGPVALSLLSWALRQQKLGFYIVLSELAGDDG